MAMMMMMMIKWRGMSWRGGWGQGGEGDGGNIVKDDQRAKEIRKQIRFHFSFIMIAKTTMTCFNINVTQAWATASGARLGRVQH